MSMAEALIHMNIFARRGLLLYSPIARSPSRPIKAMKDRMGRTCPAIPISYQLTISVSISLPDCPSVMGVVAPLQAKGANIRRGANSPQIPPTMPKGRAVLCITLISSLLI